jgi:hypothetical protein
VEERIRSTIEGKLNKRCEIDCRDQDNCGSKKQCLRKEEVKVAKSDIDFSTGTTAAECGKKNEPCRIGSYPATVGGVKQPLTCSCECKEEKK